MEPPVDAGLSTRVNSLHRINHTPCLPFSPSPRPDWKPSSLHLKLKRPHRVWPDAESGSIGSPGITAA
jgi:hypothetical protein